MAHSYTPGLKVLSNVEILKERRLPLKGKVIVENGASVLPDDIVAKTDLPGNVQMIKIANQLNVDASDIKSVMKVSVGSKVKKGQMIAQNQGIFGFFKSDVKSPIDAQVEKISDSTGQVVLREAPIPVEVDAYTSGKVSTVIESEGVVIRSQGVFVQGIFGIGGENRGPIKIVCNNREEEISEEMITQDLEGKIIIGGSFISLAAYKKAIKFKVSGVVVGGFNYFDLKEILGYTLGVAITGTENLGTSLILTEGYGSIPMSENTFSLLKSHSKKFCSINGATQIRAGVIRPEIVIPLSIDEQNNEPLSKKEISGIEPGSLVRVIRAPYFGVIGTVSSLPSELREMESETMVRVAIIDIEGVQTEIPRSNLEMVEIA